MMDIIKGVVLGHAVADALGAPVEFCSRKELEEKPVTKMLGFGSYAVPAGSWSDDTSMSLCAFASLAEDKIDYDEIMQNFGEEKCLMLVTLAASPFTITIVQIALTKIVA